MGSPTPTNAVASGHHVEISMDWDQRWSMKLDGVPLKNVRGVDFSSWVNDIASVTVQFFPSRIDIDYAGVEEVREGIHFFPSWRELRQSLRLWRRYRWRRFRARVSYRWRWGW